MHGIKMKNLLETGNIPSSESWETNLIEKVLKPFLLGKYTGKKSSFFTVYIDRYLLMIRVNIGVITGLVIRVITKLIMG